MTSRETQEEREVRARANIRRHTIDSFDAEISRYIKDDDGMYIGQVIVRACDAKSIDRVIERAFYGQPTSPPEPPKSNEVAAEPVNDNNFQFLLCLLLSNYRSDTIATFKLWCSDTKDFFGRHSETNRIIRFNLCPKEKRLLESLLCGSCEVFDQLTSEIRDYIKLKIDTVIGVEFKMNANAVELTVFYCR